MKKNDTDQPVSKKVPNTSKLFESLKHVIRNDFIPAFECCVVSDYRQLSALPSGLVG